MASSFPPAALKDLAAEVSALLKSTRQTVSVAETAAGGLISAALLSTPGASAFYRGGLTLYTLQSRVALAGWTPDDVAAYQGPTPGVVQGLAEHVRATLGGSFALCESGTAGPTGGTTRNRTPGYVALAVAWEGDGTVTREVETGLGGDREGNMVAFAVEGLKFLRDVVKGER